MFPSEQYARLSSCNKNLFTGLFSNCPVVFISRKIEKLTNVCNLMKNVCLETSQIFEGERKTVEAK